LQLCRKSSFYSVGSRPADPKKALCKDITDAMVKNYKVPAEAVVITLVETPKTVVRFRKSAIGDFAAALEQHMPPSHLERADHAASKRVNGGRAVISRP
jgi:phenylpyruvate tautomerase PptA (4-oxalocrotonate tautomerase family)